MPNSNKNNKKELSPKVMPNNLEAEQAVICSALVDNLAAESVLGALSPEDFYSESHKIIFDAMKQLYLTNKPVDFVSVVDALTKREQLEAVGGINYITTLTNVVPSAAYHAHYTEIVKRDSTLRHLIEECSKIITKAYDADDTSVLAEAEKSIYEIGQQGAPSGLEKMAGSFNDAMSTFEEINKNGGQTLGLKTGFIALDKKLGGLQKSDLIIIAARPGLGKTSLAMNIATNAAIESRAKCAVFNLEMNKEQLAQRMLCSVAGVDMTKARGGELTEQDWLKLWNAHTKLVDTQIYCDDSSLNKPSQIIQKCRKLKRERGLDLIVIDYLQLMTGEKKSDNRQTEVAELSRQMKTLAKELNVPVLVLSQLSRDIDKRPNHRPVLADLRESGAIEQDADIVIFIERKGGPETATSATGGFGNFEDINAQMQARGGESFEAELIVAKFRNGEPGSVFVGWDGKKVSFVNLAHDANRKSLEDQYESMHGEKKVLSDDANIFEELPESELPQDYLDGLEVPPEEVDIPQEMPPIDDIIK